MRGRPQTLFSRRVRGVVSHPVLPRAEVGVGVAVRGGNGGGDYSGAERRTRQDVYDSRAAGGRDGEERRVM